MIELVTKLVELRMIDVLYTSDGKTYLTQQQLSKEIKDELIVHGGKWNIKQIIMFPLSFILKFKFNGISCL